MAVVIQDLVVEEVAKASPIPVAPGPTTDLSTVLAELRRRLEIAPRRAARARAH